MHPLTNPCSFAIRSTGRLDAFGTLSGWRDNRRGVVFNVVSGNPSTKCDKVEDFSLYIDCYHLNVAIPRQVEEEVVDVVRVEAARVGVVARVVQWLGGTEEGWEGGREGGKDEKVSFSLFLIFELVIKCGRLEDELNSSGNRFKTIMPLEKPRSFTIGNHCCETTLPDEKSLMAALKSDGIIERLYQQPSYIYNTTGRPNIMIGLHRRQSGS